MSAATAAHSLYVGLMDMDAKAVVAGPRFERSFVRVVTRGRDEECILKGVVVEKLVNHGDGC